MFKKVLIANRGEIACRVARTCRRLGIATATVHSSADREALHVREIGDSVLLGDAPAAASYLDIRRVVAAARSVGADAVHPGYGFLAENADFAEALAAAGIAFIGPCAAVLRRFGDKAAAKAEATAAGLPVIAGTKTPTSSVPELVAEVERMRLPVLLKAAAGGGGKGMRVVSSRDTLVADIEAATREGRSAFGDPALIVERYLPDARHVEVQILGDGAGGVIHLLDRECSLQRRHQKVIEEAPVASLDETTRRAILSHAVRLGEAASYRGLGTVEFIVKDGEPYFLEVNPRIQVEHPVTEEVIGCDLVELQIRSVAEARLPLTQEAVAARRTAIEARLYAEDPATDFLPSTGRVELLRLPSGIRVDTGIDTGMSVTQHYDPMIAKLIAVGADRREALGRLSRALEETAVAGVRTNLPLLRALVADPEVERNALHTGTVARISMGLAEIPPADPRDVAIAAALWLYARRGAERGAWQGWSTLCGWRARTAGDATHEAPALQLSIGSRRHDVGFGAIETDDVLPVVVDGTRFDVRLPKLADMPVLVEAGDRTRSVFAELGADRVSMLVDAREVVVTVEPFLSSVARAGGRDADVEVRAPMMGQVITVDVEPGQAVSEGDRLMVVESMKMEIPLCATVDGVASAVLCTVGDMVARDQCVVRIDARPEAAA